MVVTRDEAISVAEEAVGIPLPHLAVAAVDSLIAAGAIVIPAKRVDWEYDPDTDRLVKVDG